MPDFAPNFTARYTLVYSSLGHVHKNLWRIARGAGVAGLNNTILKAAAFYNALTAARYTDWTAISATYQAEDSDVSVPAAVPTINAGTGVIPAQAKSQGIVSTCFPGRSNLGQKARLFVYGMSTGPEDQVTPSDDFRLTAAENALINAAVVVLNNGSPNLVASDNAVVGWYTYADIKFNDHWLRKIRS